MRNDQMMQAAPAAPSAPAMVAVIRPVDVEARQVALRAERRRPARGRRSGSRRRPRRAAPSADCRAASVPGAAARRTRPTTARRPPRRSPSPFVSASRCVHAVQSGLRRTLRRVIRMQPRLEPCGPVYTLESDAPWPIDCPCYAEDQTEVGSYFVATYPPFSVWTDGGRRARRACRRSHAPPVAGVPLGLYLHIPFCRKRCHFCYFRVYTDKNAQEVGDYLDVAGARVGALRDAAGDRRPAARTSSTSAAARRRSSRRSSSKAWSTRLTAVTPVDAGRGDHVRVRAGHADRSQARGHPPHRRHASQPRRRELRRRDPRAERPRAPVARDRSAPTTFARSLDFPQINIDLIAGMLGETDENWRRCVEQDAGARSPTA